MKKSFTVMVLLLIIALFPMNISAALETDENQVVTSEPEKIEELKNELKAIETELSELKNEVIKLEKDYEETHILTNIYKGIVSEFPDGFKIDFDLAIETLTPSISYDLHIEDFEKQNQSLKELISNFKLEFADSKEFAEHYIFINDNFESELLIHTSKTLTENEAKEKQIEIFVNDEKIDYVPIAKNHFLYLPIRPVLESLGYSVSYNEAEKIILIEKNNKIFTFYIYDGFYIFVDDMGTTTLHSRDIIEENKAYLSGLFLNDSFDAKTTWDSKNNKIYVGKTPDFKFLEKYPEVPDFKEFYNFEPEIIEADYGTHYIFKLNKIPEELNKKIVVSKARLAITEVGFTFEEPETYGYIATYRKGATIIKVHIRDYEIDYLVITE